MQDWRATLIPVIAVPVSLIGTFVFMAALGFSINMLSLLGLVLAVALVVDDAIVVVENVMRKLDEGATDIQQVTREAIAEVRGPIIATTLVLIAVFVPVSFIPGMTGQLYNQFSLTIAISVFLSGFNSLTLSPALSAVFLRPGSGKKNALFRAFNSAFDGLANGYATSVKVLSKVWVLVMLSFAGLVALMVYMFEIVPTGFVPAEDQGYVMMVVGLPEGATVERTKAVMARAGELARETPGVASSIDVSGYNLIDSLKQPYAGVAFIVLEPWDERKTPDTQLLAIISSLQAKVAKIPEARVLIVNAPSIPGLGSTGGFTFEIQDLNGQGIDALGKVADNFIEQARKRPELAGIYTTFNTEAPKRFLEIDRVKAKTRGVSITDIFDTLQLNMGSLFVNEFNRYGRVYRVYLQAEKEDRDEVSDIGRLHVQNKAGEMIPLDAFVTIKPIVGPFIISHYNEYKSVAIQGGNAPGFSTGQAIQAMEELAKTALPEVSDSSGRDSPTSS